MQLLGVASETNVAEGYPRFAPTPSQAAILGRLSELMDEARGTPFPELEVRAHAAFFHALGQRSAPIGTGRIVSLYASTIAIDVAATSLARRVKTIGLVNPVIDCIPALLRARGLELVPMSEKVLAGADPFAAHPEVEAIITANPNNPTGTVMPPATLRRLAEACAARGAPLVIDQCFRAFDTRTQYDTYELLDETGVEYVVIEDTGKLWPTGGVKLGFLVWGSRARLDCHEVASDVLLTAPSFSTILVEQFAIDMAAGGLQALHDRIATNRALLHAAMAGCARAVPFDGSSRVSVSRLRLGDALTGTRLWGQLLREGVHSVPCRPFYWANPRTGERYLRIALAREPEVIERAARAVRKVVEADGREITEIDSRSTELAPLGAAS
jgi:aspartate/methionine/tyrosine aminotransferase